MSGNDKENKKKILLVDDDEDVLTAMEVALKQIENIEIEKAANGNQAIDKIDKLNPDVVVLDMMLPKRSGFLVMERIKRRRQKNNTNLPKVIMVTGNPGQRHKEYAKSLGVDEYLNKPFRMDKFVSIIQGFIKD